MKISTDSLRPSKSVRGKSLAAFSLPEALIASTLFLLLLAGVVGANLFGMRMFQLTETKLKANDGARRALGLIADEIRRCNAIWIGNVSNGTFVALLNTEALTGSALMIQPATNVTNFVIYYCNPNDQTFRRSLTQTATTSIIAQAVTNTVAFTAQDYFGNVLTNAQDNRVIHVMLEFFQPQPWLPVGDYSKVETSVTRRVFQ